MQRKFSDMSGMIMMIVVKSTDNWKQVVITRLAFMVEVDLELVKSLAEVCVDIKIVLCLCC